MKDNHYEFTRKMLLDENNEQPLTMENDQGVRIDFEQIFVVEQEGGLFCILRPLTSIEGLSVHAALVFSVDENGVFRAVREKQLSEEIFAEHYGAIQRAQKKEGQ